MLTNKSGGTITGGGIIQSAAQVVNLLGGSILATSTVVELQFTNANTVGNAGTIGAAAGATLTFGAAGVGSAVITNFGTINLTGGTLNSGNITNLANGFLGGTGTITASVVNQGGRVNLGATIADNFLQTAGSFTVSRRRYRHRSGDDQWRHARPGGRSIDGWDAAHRDRRNADQRRAERHAEWRDHQRGHGQPVPLTPTSMARSPTRARGSSAARSAIMW